jgi:hypothetical protein
MILKSSQKDFVFVASSSTGDRSSENLEG